MVPRPQQAISGISSVLMTLLKQVFLFVSPQRLFDSNREYADGPLQQPGMLGMGTVCDYRRGRSPVPSELLGLYPVNLLYTAVCGH